MKRSMLALALVAGLLVASPAYAEDASPSPTASGLKGERQELRQEIKTERKNLRSQFNLARASVRANILTKKFEFIGKRFDNIIARFDARIKILQDAGKGTELTTTIAKLDIAKAQLVTAKAAAQAAINGFKAITVSSNKDDFAALQGLVKTSNEDFRAVNTTLKDALKELKTVSKPALPAASAAVNNSL